MDDVAPSGSVAGTRPSSALQRRKTKKTSTIGDEEQEDSDEEEDVDGREEDEEKQPEREVQVPTMYRWISTSRIPAPTPLAGETERPADPAEQHMQITFSVPVTALPQPLVDNAATSSSNAAMANAPFHARTRPITCSAPGCSNPFRYRLVKDWTRGACGVQHLKLLEKTAT